MVDLAVRGVGQDDQGVAFRDPGERLGDVGVRTPVGDVPRDLVAFRFHVLEGPPRARAPQRILDEVLVGFVRPEHLVEAVGLEVVEELLHPVGQHPVREQGACPGGHLEVGQRAIEVEGDELQLVFDRSHLRRLRRRHSASPSSGTSR